MIGKRTYVHGVGATEFEYGFYISVKSTSRLIPTFMDTGNGPAYISAKSHFDFGTVNEPTNTSKNLLYSLIILPCTGINPCGGRFRYSTGEHAA